MFYKPFLNESMTVYLNQLQNDLFFFKTKPASGHRAPHIQALNYHLKATNKRGITIFKHIVRLTFRNLKFGIEDHEDHNGDLKKGYFSKSL